MLTGTLVNAAAILVGSLLGMLLTWLAGHFSTLLPAGSTLLAERLKTIIMQGVALCVMYLGISGCLEGNNSLIAILSMVLGALIGELLDLDKRMRSLGDWVQNARNIWSPTADRPPFPKALSPPACSSASVPWPL